MIRSLVFHIGDPKNGSTSIQQALQARAWHCAQTTIIPQEELNASALARALDPEFTTPEKYQRQIGAKKKWVAENTGDLGVISAEFFFSVPPETLMAMLRKEFPEQAATARVIAYVRPHAPYAVSSFAQGLKTGMFTTGTRHGLAGFIEHRTQRDRLTYLDRFSQWRKVFEERFTLRPFIREDMAGGDVVQDFFTTLLREEPFTLSPIPASNQSLTLEELAGIRVLQSALIARKVPVFLRLSLGGAIGQGLARQTERTKNRLSLHRAGAEMLAETCRTDATALDAAFFEGAPMTRALEQAVSTARPDPQSLEPEDYFSPAAMKDLRRLAAQIAKRLAKRPHAWRQQYQARIGQRPETDQDPAQVKNARAVWRALDEVYPLLASGRARG